MTLRGDGFWLMGIPVTVTADDPALLAAALAGYGGPAGPSASPGAGAEAGGEPPLHLHLFLATDIVRRDEIPLDIRVEGERISLLGGGASGWADAARGEARCVVAPALLADPARLAAEVLDTLLLFVATRRGRVPVHASGVVAGGTAAVLAGPSGTGKSTLALAAHRAGLPVLSDDTVYVQTAPGLRVWGLPRPIHVFPHDAPGGEDGAMRLRSGRWKRAVALPAAPSPAGRAALFLLERGGRAALHPVETETAVERMTALLEPGFDHFRRELPGVVRALSAGGAWRLTLSADPADAVRLIRETLAS
ncbi:MAG TPA: hypothetical protein VFJ82_02305 [Longimicrobium sp.]|nr:hypothetical protein [Longimicrobium sp.]